MWVFDLVSAHYAFVVANAHWISVDRVLFYAAHFPVYWGLCLVLHLCGLGRLSPEQEKKNLVSRSHVALRVLEVQTSQFFSYVGLDLLWMLPNPAGNILGSIRWLYVLAGILLFDLVEYVMHRLYHHPLLYKHVHKPHHLLWCPYPYSALYNGKIEYTVTGAMLFVAFRLSGFSQMEFVMVNLLGTFKTVLDHTWFGDKERFHWVHHEVDIQKNFEQPWTDIYDRIFGTKYYPKAK